MPSCTQGLPDLPRDRAAKAQRAHRPAAPSRRDRVGTAVTEEEARGVEDASRGVRGTVQPPWPSRGLNPLAAPRRSRLSTLPCGDIGQLRDEPHALRHLVAATASAGTPAAPPQRLRLRLSRRGRGVRWGGGVRAEGGGWGRGGGRRRGGLAPARGAAHLEGAADLAPALVRDHEDGAHGLARMLAERALDLGRVDVLAGGRCSAQFRWKVLARRATSLAGTTKAMAGLRWFGVSVANTRRSSSSGARPARSRQCRRSP
jgi:hypothetical protein